MNLDGASVLVTGASRGIGKAWARALGERGARVFGASRGGPIACDVTDPDQVRALRSETGPVDLLVNNAAIIHEPAPLWEVPPDVWEAVLRTNVLGTVALMRAYLPAMNERGRGICINLSSAWGRVAEAEQAPYCASKFAVEALTQSAAAEVADGVAVVALNPGVVATEMLATAFGGDVSAYPTPAETAPSFVSLVEAMDASWNGRSLTLPARA